MHKDLVFIPQSPHRIKRLIWILALMCLGVEAVNLIPYFHNHNIRAVAIARLGVSPTLPAFGDWWGIANFLPRLLGYILVDFGPFHALGNAVAILFFADALSRRFGPGKTVLLALVTTLVGAMAFIALASRGLLIGGSALSYGLLGGMLAFWPRLHYFYIVPVILMIMAAVPLSGAGVAWQAHFSSVLMGMAMSYLFVRYEKKQAEHQPVPPDAGGE